MPEFKEDLDLTCLNLTDVITLDFAYWDYEFIYVHVHEKYYKGR